MRSPVLAFALFAVATVSAQTAVHVRAPRQYGGEPDRRTQDPTHGEPARRPDEIESGVPRPDRPRPPPPPHVDFGHGVIPTDGDLNGGVSDTQPAVGNDAEQGGGSMTTSSGDSASGTDLFNVGEQVGNVLPGAANAQGQLPSQGTGYAPTTGYAYSHHRMRRVLRSELKNNSTRRDDSLLPDDGGVAGWDLPTPNENDDPNGDDDDSGHDGADGVSQRGSETDGDGPNGGHAHSGEVGSSEGGHVYNEPASASG
ncbi:hypothetical protein PYCCODRAFT_1071275 [Trametes coccinea BRFM310]|uniref:Uncharacterized protein n=1 Tax=Trametes coccinea (strain BRFM310) TaxID=1353009 RepID=A0A1Y2IZN0_TRAC3|nr:hypothetical protein PYCCODRAFT_1071275 [Trametes coccinea BRFM310]